MFRACRIVLIIWLLMMANLTSMMAGLPDQYHFSLLNSKNGLSHGQVNCILKDSRGYVWIGTAAGLNRYDGYQVKVFRHDPGDSMTINANDVNKLFEDPAGNIWIGTYQGFNVYNPHTETFHRNYEDFLKDYQLPNTDIENIFKDQQGNYWFIHTGHGISRFDPVQNNTVNLRHSAAGKNSISSNYVSAIQQDSRGNLWLVHRNGMLEQLNGHTLAITERYDDIYRQFDRELLFYGLTIDSDDDLWIYLPYDRHGVFFLDHQDKSLHHFHKDSEKLALNNNLVRGVVENSKGEIWVGTDHGGINLIDKKDFSIRYILHNPEIEKSLAHNSVYALYKDDEGMIWIGTYKKGVNYYHKNMLRFQHHKHQVADSKSLPYDDVNRFAEDDKGNLWIGTNGGGLLYLDRSTGKYRRFTHDPADPNSISSDVIVSLLYDHENSVLWIGTYYGGLNKFDGKKFTHYRHNPANPSGLSDDNIWELFKDSRGNLWVGTLSQGLECYAPDGKKLRHYKGSDEPATISSDYILAINEDEQGNIWVGGSAGIDLINPLSGNVRHFENEPGNLHSPISNTVLDIYRDSENNMWVASPEGLSLFQAETATFRHFTVKDGLPHNTVLTILEDERQNLWLGTPNGLSQFSIDQQNEENGSFSFRNYDECDGLQERVFNENAAFKTSRGELIFGGSNGFNIFKPESIGENTRKPRLVFTDFQLFNESIGIGQSMNGRVMLPESLSDAGQITLRHDENVFSIAFAALNFLHPEKNSYQYRLEGFDRDWLTADNTTRRVTYTNLDPGEYTFKVLASNNDGIWNNEGISMHITVLAPFWKTNAAYAFYAFLVLAALYVGRRIMLQRARLKFRMEQERREARQMHELDLMKIRFFTNVSHEFRTPLSLILAPAEKLLQQTGDEKQTRQFQMIHRNARRLLNLVNQLLDFRKLEVEGISFYPSEGNIIRFIEESVHSFSDLSEKKNIALGFHTNVPELHASFDMDKLEKILFNLLSNAFKFTPENGEVRVTVNCQDNDSASEGLKILEISVRDTGIGIAADKHQKVFERFFRNDVPDSMLNQGSGIGLSITREFVKIHGGTIHLESSPDAGSCFTVSIPVKEIRKPDHDPYTPKNEPVAVAIPEKESAGTKTAPTARKKRIYSADEKMATVLLVEDNEDFRFYLKDNLGVHFNIIEAGNGKEGWQKALAAMPDMIVSDLMMPEMNGIDFCRKVKNDPRTSHLPFVLLTAHTAREQKFEGLDIGANDYITKPFNFEILLSRIKNIIRQQHILQQVLEKKISVQTSEAEITSPDEQFIRKAIQLVEDNMEKPELSVQMLSRELGMSRANLYNKLLALTGHPPAEFIRRIRLQRAAQFLEKSQLTVAEVAYKVGFNNAKYFSRYFKKEYNVLPSLYASSKKK